MFRSVFRPLLAGGATKLVKNMLQETLRDASTPLEHGRLRVAGSTKI
jgi:hypothetical protein